jgi:serine/threonine-protein kinase
MEAYDLYLKGRHLWGRRTEDAISKSRGYFERALQRDPHFALAEAAIADLYVTLGLYGMRAPRDVMPRAREAANRALAIDLRQAGALTSLAAVRSLFDWDWHAAERDYLRAIELEPQYAIAHQWLAANLYTPLGRFDEARASLQTALQFEPLSAPTAATQGVITLYSGDAPRAVEELEHTVDLHEDFGPAHYFLGMALDEAGDNGLAIEALRRAALLTGRSSEVLAALAHALATGHPGEATTLENELETRSQERYVSPALLAQIRIAFGDHAGAMDRLEAAADARAIDLVWLAVRPTYHPLKENPRFRALLKRVKLTQG